MDKKHELAENPKVIGQDLRKCPIQERKIHCQLRCIPKVPRQLWLNSKERKESVRPTKRNSPRKDFMSRLFKKSAINGLDTMSHCDVNAMGTRSGTPGGATVSIKMMSVLEHCALFNLTDMKAENKRAFPSCDMHDKQNGKEATECLMNSLEETLCKQIGVKLEEDVLFANAAMLFVETVRPQNSKLHVHLKKKITEFNTTKCPGANIKAMVSDLREIVTSMMRGNACNSKHNATIAQKLTNAGGSNNEEHSVPMHNHLNAVKEEECKVGHLGNMEKHKAMALENVSITDMFRKAEDLHVQQTTNGNVHWRLALNMGNANLAQMQPNRLMNDKRFKRKNNHKKKFNWEMNSNGKNRTQPHECWRNTGAGKGDKPDRHEGDTPIFKRRW